MSTSPARPQRPAPTPSPSLADTTPTYVGGVTVTGPTPKGYYRLKWREPDGTPGDTSGSRDLTFALEKAADIDRQISQAAGPRATTCLEQLVAEFIAHGRSPYKDKQPYKQTHLDGLEHKLRRGLRGLRARERVRAMDLDRATCDIIRAQAGTHNGVTENTSALRAFLRWSYQHQYFTAEQVELLPRAGAIPEPAWPRVRTLVENGGRPGRARVNGQHEDYVDEEDCPNPVGLARLATALQRRFPLWGALACELAAGAGPRWGEEFQLRATDVHLDGCHRYGISHIHVDWQIAPTGRAGQDRTGNRRDRPKGNKTRVIPVPETSITGHALRDALRARVAAAQAEQLEGLNPEALLFPAERGGLLWHTSFYGDHLLPAMVEAGLPVEIWQVEEYVWDEARMEYVLRRRTERHAVFSWHSLRHRFARTCVDIHQMSEGELMAIGGWENIATVQTRYYRSGEENMNRGLGHFG